MANLKDYGIKNILAIDDIFYNIEFETEVSLLDEQTIGKFDILNNLNGDFIFYAQGSNEQQLSDFFDEYQIDNSVAKAMLDLVNQVQQDSYKQLASIPDISFFKCVPETSKIKTILDSLDEKDERTLIILDRKLSGKNEINGRSLLSSILVMISEYLKNDGNLFLIMYSSEPKELFSYTATTEYLRNDLTLTDDVIDEVALHVNFLSKDNSNESEFINVLRKSQKANYVNSFNEIFDKSIRSLRERVWDLNHNESLFHYDYLVEGQQIDQIIFEIFSDKFKASYMDYMSTDFVRLINPMRNSIQKYESNRVSEEPVGLDKAPAKYRFIKEVNTKLHGGSNTTSVFASDDISFGDIISIGESSYVVVSQNCDVTIRNDGERAVQTFQLIKVVETKETINAKWLESFLRKYALEFKPKKINLNLEGSEYFKNTFYNSSNKTELQLMGFEERCLKEIELTLDLEDTNKQLKKLEFDGYDKDLGDSYQYEIDKNSKEIYTVPCFWLDLLLLRTNDEGEKVVTMETINSSKEIRYATKIRIKNDFTERIEKLSLLSQDNLITAFKNSMFNPLINVEPMFDEKKKLYGFRLLNISRSKKMKPHVARKIHLEMISKQTREAVNESIPI
jgi:hypothetical protein